MDSSKKSRANKQNIADTKTPLSDANGTPSKAPPVSKSASPRSGSSRAQAKKSDSTVLPAAALDANEHVAVHSVIEQRTTPEDAQHVTHPHSDHAPVHSGHHDHRHHHVERHTVQPPSAGRTVVRVVCGFAIIAVLITIGVLPRLKQEKKLAAMADSQKHSTLPVDVVRPQYSPSTTEVVLPGNIQAIEETAINARTSGYLQRRYVDIGSRVKIGQVLAEIEAPELDHQLMRARAEASKSQATSEQAQADHVKMTANVAQARAEVDKTRSNLEATRADLAHANAKLTETEGSKSEAMAKVELARKRLKGQQAGLDRAQTRLALAKKTWERWQKLARGGAVSGQELDEVQATYESSQSDVAAAQANVDSAQSDIDAAQQAVRAREGDVAAANADVSAYTQKVKAATSGVTSAEANVDAMRANVLASKANIRAATAGISANQANVASYATLRNFERVTAPMNGVITARNVDVGALINAGSSSNLAADPTSTVPHTGLFGIARTDILRVQVQIPQALVSTIKKGQQAQLIVQEYPGRTFTGTVFGTSGALDANSRTLLTEIRVNNPDNALMPGMFARVKFMVNNSRPGLRVPANTLVIDKDGVRVATVTDGQLVHFKQVKVGRDFGKEVEVTEGLIGSERLITNPTDELNEGMPVRVATSAK